MIENYGLAGPTGAEFSDCASYRYLLWRVWSDALPPLGVIMLNPSTADDRVNDPTIRRVIARATANHYGGIIVGNLYGFRSKSPKDLWVKGRDPVGPHNDSHLLMIAKLCPTVLLAWGANAERGRGLLVKEMLQNMDGQKPRLMHLGLTKDGQPRHPLYLRNDQPNIYYPVPMTTDDLPPPEVMNGVGDQFPGEDFPS